MSRIDQQKRSRPTDSDSDDDQPHPKKSDTNEQCRSDAEDRAWLKQLSEREREAELLKRHEERERLKHHEEITKRLKAKGGKESESSHSPTNENDGKKPSISRSVPLDNDIYDDEDRPSSHCRQQTNATKQKATQHSKTLQTLIEGRKKKQDEIARKTLPKRADLSSSDDELTNKSLKTTKWETNDVYGTSDSDDDENTTDHRRARSRSPTDRKATSRPNKSTRISTKFELKSMMLTRFRMEKWCHSPFFPKVAKGAFVRINIGQNNGQPVYRICEIGDVVETSKIYNLGSTRTNKGLRLKHGNHERVFRLEFVSNKDISDSEFKRWREALQKQGISLPTLETLEKKIEAIDKCKQYVYNDIDITKIVDEKSRFRKAPINYAMSKNDLQKEIETARYNNDRKKENELKKKLDEIEERASELDRKRTENISVMTQINRRNRKSTQQNVEMALAREAQEHRNAAADPFTRRRCAPVLVSKAVQTKEELIRELQLQRIADEAAVAAKRRLEEQHLTVEKTQSKQTSRPTRNINSDQHIFEQQNFSSIPTHERGSFATFSDTTDEMFTSHDFELDMPFKLFSD